MFLLLLKFVCAVCAVHHTGADHCIFCGATSYAKYPLIECNGKCGRKSHLVYLDVLSDIALRQYSGRELDMLCVRRAICNVRSSAVL